MWKLNNFTKKFLIISVRGSLIYRFYHIFVHMGMVTPDKCGKHVDKEIVLKVYAQESDCIHNNTRGMLEENFK